MINRSIRSNCHERLADALRDEFRSLPAGTRLDSIARFSARYEVSAVTVRLALALLQGEGRVTLRHGSGCYVSRPGTKGHKRPIAILSEYNILRSPRSAAVFYSHVMDELRRFLESKGVSSRLYIGHVGADKPHSGKLTCSELMEDLTLDRIGGVAALATLPLFDWTEQARIKQIPIVGMGGWSPRFSGAVDPDFPAAIHGALVRLVGNGRRRPAFIGWDKDSCDHFKIIVAGLGLTLNPHWIRIGLNPAEAGAGWSDFREIWAAGDEKTDSVIFGDDVLFEDALPAIQATGVRIPDALEVVVMANKGIPLPRPFPYTRMDCDPAEIAGAMGSLLLQCMAGEPPALRQIAIPYRWAAQDVTGDAVDQWVVPGSLDAPHEFRTQKQVESRP